jgi:TPR repeat protein
MERLGYAYLVGRGTEIDYPEAAAWFAKSADLGSATASYYIGEMLRRGLGMASNPGRASEWMLSAAEQDHAAAQYTLARMYADGNGLAVNREEAIKWMTKSAELGDEDAKEWLEEQGLPLQQA